MAGAIAFRDTPIELGALIPAPVARGAVIWGGTIVVFDPALEGCVPATDRQNTIAAGIAASNANNRKGQPGDVSVPLRRRGRFLFDTEIQLTAKDMWRVAYPRDDHTIITSDSGPNGPAVGIVVGIEQDKKAWLEVDWAVSEGRRR